MKYLYSFAAGAAFVTAAVVLTGARSLTIFSLGFLSAVALTFLLCRLIGAARLTRLLSGAQEPARAAAPAERPAAGPVAAPQAATRPAAVTPINFLDEELISALTNLKVARKVAAAAVREAHAQAPAEFEPLFRAALNIVRSKAA
jgi:hypothetical protein